MRVPSSLLSPLAAEDIKLIVLFLFGTVVIAAALACCLYSQLMGVNKEPLESFRDALNYLSMPKLGAANNRMLSRIRLAAHTAVLATITFTIATVHHLIHYLFEFDIA